MSWCEPRGRNIRRSRHGGAFAVAAGLAMLFLAGCSAGEGFRPMYAATGSTPGVQEKLAKVEISSIPSRVGQRIRNELIFQNTGGGLPEKPEYRLDITITESLGSALVTSTGEAQSQIYTLNASFKLFRLRDKSMVFEGTSQGRAEFERFQQIYANVRARDDAENRAAKSISDDIKTRLSAVLSSSRI